MAYTTLFLDLDDTLYPPTNGLWNAIGVRMDEFIRLRLGLPQGEISALRRRYFLEYGTTMRGLQLHHQVDAEDFLEFVHDLPVEQIVLPDPELQLLLDSLPQPKFIFTNSNRKHATRVLNALGITNCIRDVIDITAMEYISKPDPRAYRQALRLAGESDPLACVYLDDSVRNLAPAHIMGFFTVLVGSHVQDPVARLAIDRPHDLRQAMPELWNHHRLSE